MKAAVVNEWGAAPVYTEFADPRADETHVVAAVEASALTNLTRALVSGKHYASREIRLPAIPGVDGVARLADGRRVYSSSLGSNGMMAEKTLVDESAAIVLPEHVDSVTAAAVPNPGMSAWLGLYYGANLQPGQRVLILGATGVTGSLAAQLAASEFDAGRVVVAGRNTERLDRLVTLGADAAITLGRDDLAEQVAARHADQPFDAVLDFLWGEPAQTVLTALAASHPAAHFHSTRFVQIGSMAGPDITLPAGIVRGNGITISGVGIGSVPPEVWALARDEALPRLFAGVAAGRLELTTVSRPLSEVAQAWESREPSGTRVVLTP